MKASATRGASCGVLLAVAGALFACVPPSDPLPPAGAAGFTTEPSAAARGEAITTDDGWVVRFEKVIVRASVTAMPRWSEGSFEGDMFFWNGAARADLYTSGLPVGPYSVALSLKGKHIAPDYETSDDVVSLGVSREDEARFRRPPDEGGALGPNLWVVLRAEKSGRVLVLDVAMNVAAPFGPAQMREVEVRADALATVPLGVAPERLFTDEPDGSQLRFEPFARADADGDGRLTTDELIAAPEISEDAEAEGLVRGGLMRTLMRRGETVVQ